MIFPLPFLFLNFIFIKSSFYVGMEQRGGVVVLEYNRDFHTNETLLYIQDLMMESGSAVVDHKTNDLYFFTKDSLLRIYAYKYVYERKVALYLEMKQIPYIHANPFIVFEPPVSVYVLGGRENDNFHYPETTTEEEDAEERYVVSIFEIDSRKGFCDHYSSQGCNSDYIPDVLFDISKSLYTSPSDFSAFGYFQNERLFFLYNSATRKATALNHTNGAVWAVDDVQSLDFAYDPHRMMMFGIRFNDTFKTAKLLGIDSQGRVYDDYPNLPFFEVLYYELVTLDTHKDALVLIYEDVHSGKHVKWISLVNGSVVHSVDILGEYFGIMRFFHSRKVPLSKLVIILLSIFIPFLVILFICCLFLMCSCLYFTGVFIRQQIIVNREGYAKMEGGSGGGGKVSDGDGEASPVSYPYQRENKNLRVKKKDGLEDRLRGIEKKYVEDPKLVINKS